MVRVCGIVGRTEGAKKKQINEMISKQMDLGFVSVLPHACVPVPSCQSGSGEEGELMLSQVLLTLIEQLLGLHCLKADLEPSNVRHSQAVSGESRRRRSHTGFGSGRREFSNLAHGMS